MCRWNSCLALTSIGAEPVVGLGLYGGALVNGTIKPTGGSSESVLITATSRMIISNVYDFGLLFYYRVLATKPGFLFGIDYQHGFMQVVPDGFTQANGQPRMNTHNSVWGLHLGWIFQL